MNGMIAIDANILAYYYLLNDSPAQADIAEKLLNDTEPYTAPISLR